MKRIGSILIIISVIFNLLLSTSCDDVYWHSSMVPNEITFDGRTYVITDEVVAVEQIPVEVTYAGKAYLGTPVPSSVTDENTNFKFEVYSINGIKKTEAIAIRIVSTSEKGAVCVYRKYEAKIQ